MNTWRKRMEASFYTLYIQDMMLGISLSSCVVQNSMIKNWNFPPFWRVYYPLSTDLSVFADINSFNPYNFKHWGEDNEGQRGNLPKVKILVDGRAETWIQLVYALRLSASPKNKNVGTVHMLLSEWGMLRINFNIDIDRLHII